MNGYAIQAEGLEKSYGGHPALAGIDLAVPTGGVFGILGPNGAGKTTAIQVLATLLAPDAGSAVVAGHDVVREPQRVRAAISLTGQGTSVAEALTGRENLVLFGRLRGLARRAAHRRAGELLDQFDLTEDAGRQVATYSGGMRRRLDVAASLVVEPAVLFLDEPTTGLDPRSRNALWEAIELLGIGGITVILTTQYLEEADRLADRIAIIDRGRIVAEDSPAGLKDAVGGTSLQIAATEPGGVDDVLAQLAALTNGDAVVDRAEGVVRLPVATGSRTPAEVIRRLSEAGVEVSDVSLRRPSLDDVFFALTGHPSSPDAPEGPDGPDGPETSRRPQEALR
jgi:ABC-2 type transport system ATP-binding protein